MATIKSIEEKAKAYDIALDKIKRLLGTGSNCSREELEYVFPELRESEDERIRKELIAHIKWCEDSGYCAKEEMTRWIAWLEKQGKQKPAYEVEHKFNVGDFLVSDYCMGKVVELTNDAYLLDTEQGIPFSCEHNAHIWTIQDAKDGDVLVSESTCCLGTWYCIFKSLDADESMTVYCYLARDGRFETKKELCFDKDPYSTKPATKEQRDALMKAMADAGYTFDFEKKELKKIEQKSAVWSEEDREYINDLIGVFDGQQYQAHSDEEIVKWLKSIRLPYNKEWDENDEEMLRSIIATCELAEQDRDSSPARHLLEMQLNWLKFLKDRYTWKPSDEQMKALSAINVTGSISYAGQGQTLIELYNNLYTIWKEKEVFK